MLSNCDSAYPRAKKTKKVPFIIFWREHILHVKSNGVVRRYDTFDTNHWDYVPNVTQEHFVFKNYNCWKKIHNESSCCGIFLETRKVLFRVPKASHFPLLNALFLVQPVESTITDRCSYSNGNRKIQAESILNNGREFADINLDDSFERPIIRLTWSTATDGIPYFLHQSPSRSKFTDFR